MDLSKPQIKEILLQLVPGNPRGNLVFDAYKKKTGDVRYNPVRMAMLELIEQGDVIWGRGGSLKLYEGETTRAIKAAKHRIANSIAADVDQQILNSNPCSECHGTGVDIKRQSCKPCKGNGVKDYQSIAEVEARVLKGLKSIEDSLKRCGIGKLWVIGTGCDYDAPENIIGPFASKEDAYKYHKDNHLGRFDFVYELKTP